MSKIKIIKKIAIFILVFILIYSVFVLVYSNFAQKMQYREQNAHLSITYSINNKTNLTHKEIRKKLNNAIGVHLYVYMEKDLDKSIQGRTIVLYRLIEMNKNLSVNEYIIALAHELCHLKYCSNNERFVTYKTFIELYNSEFIDSALELADLQQKGRYTREYDCWAQIYEYLKDNI